MDTGDRVDLTIKSIYRLDVLNLSRYLAQHPEIDTKELRKSKAFFALTNLRYQEDFEKRLSKAEELLYADVAAALKAYYLLKDSFVFPPLAMLILNYLEIDGSIAQRVEYEILKENKPKEADYLKGVYAEIKGLFNHDKRLRYSSDEASLILNYLAPHTGFTDVAITDGQKAEKQAGSFVAKLMSNKSSFFSKIKTSLYPKTNKPEEKKFDFSASSLRRIG